MIDGHIVITTRDAHNASSIFMCDGDDTLARNIHRHMARISSAHILAPKYTGQTPNQLQPTGGNVRH